MAAVRRTTIGSINAEAVQVGDKNTLVYNAAAVSAADRLVEAVSAHGDPDLTDRADQVRSELDNPQPRAGVVRRGLDAIVRGAGQVAAVAAAVAAVRGAVWPVP